MSSIPENLKYSEEHEWLSVEGDIATIGITDHAQSELGDIVFVELPETGDAISKDEAFGSVEAVKAVSDLFAPVSGEVVEVNEDLEENPENVNSEPYGAGWMIKVKISDAGEMDALLTHEKYKELIG